VIVLQRRLQELVDRLSPHSDALLQNHQPFDVEVANNLPTLHTEEICVSIHIRVGMKEQLVVEGHGISILCIREAELLVHF
jgi:hypothetical protein